MTKTYSPRDLRDACAMPREDAVWFMEHCAEAWEETERVANANAERVCEYFDQLQHALQRLEAAERVLHTVRECLRDGYLGSNRDAMTVLDAALAGEET